MAAKPLFQLLDHCCRICGGRLLQGEAAGREALIRCAECGTSETTGKPRPYEVLCCCGVKLASGADAGLRCRRAVKPTPEKPHEVVVKREEPDSAAPRSSGSRRPVRLPGSED